MRFGRDALIRVIAKLSEQELQHVGRLIGHLAMHVQGQKTVVTMEDEFLIITSSDKEMIIDRMKAVQEQRLVLVELGEDGVTKLGPS